jgi:expansin (peptidoglycan-binding protein)
MQRFDCSFSPSTSQLHQAPHQQNNIATSQISNMQFLLIVAFAGAVSAAAVVEKRGPTHNGYATYYTQDGNAGSCGATHSNKDLIVAISQKSPFTYNGTAPFSLPPMTVSVLVKLTLPIAHCGQTVTITNMGGGDNNYGKGNTITATVADTCPECEPDHLDLSTGAFKKLTGGQLDPPGQFNIQWHLN